MKTMGKVRGTGRTPQLSFTVPKDLHEEIKRVAATEDVSESEVVRQILADRFPNVRYKKSGEN